MNPEELESGHPLHIVTFYAWSGGVSFAPFQSPLPPPMCWEWDCCCHTNLPVAGPHLCRLCRHLLWWALPDRLVNYMMVLQRLQAISLHCEKKVRLTWNICGNLLKLKETSSVASLICGNELPQIFQVSFTFCFLQWSLYWTSSDVADILEHVCNEWSRIAAWSNFLVPP